MLVPFPHFHTVWIQFHPHRLPHRQRILQKHAHVKFLTVVFINVTKVFNCFAYTDVKYYINVTWDTTQSVSDGSMAWIRHA